MEKSSSGGRHGRRHLAWDGTWNARDLGGLRVPGGFTRWRAVVRSDSLHRVSASGWADVVAHGVRTVIDLRTTDEMRRDVTIVPAPLRVVEVPLEEGLADDAEFNSWVASGELGTPLYYRRFLERWPDRVAAALAAVARAPEGGVLVHCIKGCDRTGLVVLAMLSLIGVEHDDIVADYALSAERLRLPAARLLGREDDNVAIEAVLARHGTTAARTVREVLAVFDPRACMDAADVRRLQSRLTSCASSA